MDDEQLASDYAQIIETFPEAVIILSAAEGRVVAANRLARDFFGEAYLSLPLADRWKSVSLAGIDGTAPALGNPAGHISLYKGETVIGREVKVRKRDGRTLYVKINSAPLRAPDGSIRGAIVVFDDVTAIKRVEMSATELGAFVRHEIGGELTVAKAATHALAEHCKGCPDHEGLIEHLMSASENLCQMLDNLVAFAETLVGAAQPPRTPMALPEVVASIRDKYRWLGLPPIRVKVPKDLPSVWANEEWVRIVLRNLVDNAFKYSHPGRRVSISCIAENGHVATDVVNYGVGLQPESEEAAFEPFWRGPNAAAGDIRGMGLGLFLSRHLVEAQGGTIRISSDARGKTKASFTLPVAHSSEE